MQKKYQFHKLLQHRNGRSSTLLDTTFVLSASDWHTTPKSKAAKTTSDPQLDAAIDHARRAHTTLLIAKLDRLSRNASFILALRDSCVDFVC